MTTPLVLLSGLMAKRAGSVDPSRFPDEEFCLYSIPSFDEGAPEIIDGASIGSAKQLVSPGDVLLSRIVPHIRRAWIVEPSDGRRIIASGEWIVFRSETVEPRYLRHFLTCDGFHKRFMSTVAGVGGSLLRARAAQVASLQAPVPPLPEQRRIADILDKADAIRGKRKQAIALTKELLRSAFLEMVGPAARGYAKWPVMTIEDLAAKIPNAMRTGPFGSDLRHSEFVDEGIAVLGIDNAVKNQFTWSERRFITREKYEKLRRYTVRPRDVIVTIMGTTGRSAVVPDDIPTAITTKHLATITLNQEQADPEFVSQALFRHPDVLRQLAASNRGAIMSGLNLGLIKSLKIHTPPIDQQRKFAEVARRVRALSSRMNLGDGTEELFDSIRSRAFDGNQEARC